MFDDESWAVSPNGRYVAAVDDAEPALWDIWAGQRKARLPRSVNVAGFTRDSRFLVIASDTGPTKVRSTATGHVVSPSRENRRTTQAIDVLDPGGRFRLSQDSSSLAVTLVDAATGDRVAQFRSPGRLSAAQFSPDGAHVLLVDGATVRIEAVPRTRSARLGPRLQADEVEPFMSSERLENAPPTMGAAGGVLTVVHWRPSGRGANWSQLDAAGNVRHSAWRDRARVIGFGLSASASRAVVIGTDRRARIRTRPSWDVARNVTLGEVNLTPPARSLLIFCLVGS